MRGRYVSTCQAENLILYKNKIGYVYKREIVLMNSEDMCGGHCPTLLFIAPNLLHPLFDLLSDHQEKTS